MKYYLSLILFLIIIDQSLVVNAETFTGKETILDYVNMNIPDGYHTLQTNVNGEIVNIDVELRNFENDVHYAEDPPLGDSSADSRMLILKYHKNLTIDDGVKITPLARKKGMVIYVGEQLTNNGTISMNAKGANAEGQNVYLYKNSDNTFERIPANGAVGGSLSGAGNGIAGNNGEGRSLGGGGSGAALYYSYHRAGKGAAATSYSGGSGGGGVASFCGSGGAIDGSINGGSGGNAYTCTDNLSYPRTAGGGAGNEGGLGKVSGNSGQGKNGENGTGGLLILYATKLINNGVMQSNGTNGGDALGGWDGSGGGGSGGGSINIFYVSMEGQGNIEALGGKGGNSTASARARVGGAGGNGTYTLLQVPKISYESFDTFEISELKVLDKKMDAVSIIWENPEHFTFHHVNIYRKNKNKESTSIINKIENLFVSNAYAETDGFTPMFQTNGTYWKDMTVEPETTYEYKLTTVNILEQESNGLVIAVTTPSEPLPEMGGEEIITDENGDYKVIWTSPTSGKVKILVDGSEYAVVDASLGQYVIPKEDMVYDLFGKPKVQLVPISTTGKEGKPTKPPVNGESPGTIGVTMPFTANDFLKTVMSLIAWVGPFILLALAIYFAPQIIRFLKGAIAKFKEGKLKL